MKTGVIRVFTTTPCFSIESWMRVDFSSIRSCGSRQDGFQGDVKIFSISILDLIEAKLGWSPRCHVKSALKKSAYFMNFFLIVNLRALVLQRKKNPHYLFLLIYDFVLFCVYCFKTFVGWGLEGGGISVCVFWYRNIGQCGKFRLIEGIFIMPPDTIGR